MLKFAINFFFGIYYYITLQWWLEMTKFNLFNGHVTWANSLSKPNKLADYVKFNTNLKNNNMDKWKSTSSSTFITLLIAHRLEKFPLLIKYKNGPTSAMFSWGRGFTSHPIPADVARRRVVPKKQEGLNLFQFPASIQSPSHYKTIKNS